MKGVLEDSVPNSAIISQAHDKFVYLGGRQQTLHLAFVTVVLYRVRFRGRFSLYAALWN